MTPNELFEICDEVLNISGAPEWNAPGAPGSIDTLVYLDDDADEEEPIWCLSSADPDSDDGDFLAMDTDMAAQLIAAHLRAWLLDGGWQVQVTFLNKKPQWRLADCLPTIDGGGDRLEGDYPCGDDELRVLCESVKAVAASL